MLKEKYDALLFDLDDTLFNHSYCYKQAIRDIVKCHSGLGNVDEELFISTFLKVNQELWKDFQSNKISFRELSLKRLRMTFNKFSVNAGKEEIESINEIYHGNYLKNIVPDLQINHLIEQIIGSFKVGIITNGTSYNAYKKVQRLELNDLFKNEQIIVSEEIGYSKPHRQIFRHALDRLKIKPERTLFIGDNYYTDMCGADAAGMDTLWINPDELKPPLDFIPAYIVKSVLDIEHLE
ncbi:HAD family hydrolase [Lysinibacillus sphaericus]